MSTIMVLTTGGTIAMRQDQRAGGAIPQLSAAELLAALPAFDGHIQTEALFNLPSAHFSLDHLWRIRQRAQALAHDPAIDSLVITHGTDTMEETAYLLDLTIRAETPIVLTGAMRTASDPGYDGPANLLAALQVAAAPAARGTGTTIVLNERIHAARHVTKTDTQNPATFQSPGYGPIGYVNTDGVHLSFVPEREHIPAPRLEPRVGLIKLAVGMAPDGLAHLMERGYRGIVIEALGGGRVPPTWMPAIRAAIEAGVWIVIGSRCQHGVIHDRYGYPGAYKDLAASGALFSGGLSGPKARLKLMAALGTYDAALDIRRVLSV